MQNYDVAIIGAGVAGAFACLRISEYDKNCKTIVFDIGRPPNKRRRQLEGWLGSFPFGDGKLYIKNFQDTYDLVDGRKLRTVIPWVEDKFNLHHTKLIKSALPSKKFLKLTENLGFQFNNSDYYQWKPKQIHELSKFISSSIEDLSCFEFKFDTEVVEISFNNNNFEIKTRDNKTFLAKKVLLSVGRSGWRWLKQAYTQLDLKYQDDIAWVGLKLEMPAKLLSELNKSNCSFENDQYLLGPFCWNGSIIPEDHADLVISSFRSNEDRWKTDKVSFSLLKKMIFPNQGIYQADRLAKLAYLLSNDRVGKEKIKTIYKQDSCISLIPEYSWSQNGLNMLQVLFPDLIARGSFYVPDIKPQAPQIKLNTKLQTQLPDLAIAGEATGLFGIISAATTGVAAIDSLLR